MYNLLIVDDEPVILEGIEEAIAGADLPLKEIKTASSSQEAIELFRKTPFDIILSDISMPGMDGLTMIQETREIWPGTAVIILTGYQNFEYVRKALRLGTLDYLLKPITDEQLIQSFEAVIGKLDQQWFEIFYRKELWKQMDNSTILRQQRYFLQLMIEKEGVHTISQEKLNEINVPLVSGKSVRSIVVRYEERITEEENVNDQINHIMITNIMQNAFYGYETVFGFPYNHSYSVILLQPLPEKRLDDIAIRKMIEEMQSYFFEKAGITLSMGIISTVEWKDWMKAVLKIIAHYEEHCELGQLFITDYNSITPENVQVVQEMGEENYNYFLLRIKDYIKENPQEDLSLSALSEMFHINPSYLSRIFHKEYDCPLSAFITESRIERAKELLLNTNEKIYEISQSVGFDTAGYFTKVFNKTVGISPKEYRMTENEKQDITRK